MAIAVDALGAERVQVVMMPSRYTSQMSREDAEEYGLWAWEAINLPNLTRNILPTRSRADLILRKGPSHAIEEEDKDAHQVAKDSGRNARPLAEAP